MKNQAGWMGAKGLLAAAGLAIAVNGAQAQAVYSWGNGGGGAWNTGGNWSPAGIPGGSDTANISMAGGYTVTVTGSQAAAAVDVSNPAATLFINDGSALNVGASIANSGLIQISYAAAPGNNSRIALSGNVAVTGTGLLRLQGLVGGDGNNDSSYITYNNAAFVLNNGAGHTIAGYGRIWARYDNNGLISADVAGKGIWNLNQDKVNNGVIEAINGGLVHFASLSVTQGANGVMDADGGDVIFLGSPVTGGSLRSFGSGYVRFYGGGCGLNGVTTEGNLRIQDGGQVLINGDVVNNGTFQISEPGAPGNNTRFQINVPAATVSGTGSWVLQGTSGGNGDNDSAYITYSNAVNVLTQAAGHTIRGYGRIWNNLVNNGLISADQPGKGIILHSQDKTNNSIIQATSGGYINVRSITLSQGGSGVLSATGGDVFVTSSTISGGSVTGPGTNYVQYYGGGCGLSNVTASGKHRLLDGSQVLLNTNLVNNGTMEVSEPAAPGNNTRFQANAAAITVSGTGSWVLQGPSGGNGDTDAAYITYTAAGNVITNGPTHTIRGYGRIHAKMTNNGTINADTAPFGGPQNNIAKGIVLLGQDKINNGLMTATNGGFLHSRSITITQGVNGQIVANNSAVGVESTGVLGGLISASGANGLVTFYGGGCVLRDVTMSGSANVYDGAQVLVRDGTITNNGTIRVNAVSAPGNNTRIQTQSTTANPAAVTLAGTGSIVLDGTGNGDNDSSYLTYTGATDVLTHAATHTIRGAGRIYARIANDGTVSADRAGGVVRLLTQDKTNNGTMKAAGGTLAIAGITVTQTASGLISADITDVSVENATIFGGTLRSTGTGTVRFSGGSCAVNGVSGSGAYQVQDGATLTVQSGGLVNDGVVSISHAGAPGNNTRLITASGNPTTISGTGSVVLNSVGNTPNNDSAHINAVGTGVLTLGGGQTLAGTGRVYGSVVMNGTIAPSPSAGNPGSIGAIQKQGAALTLGGKAKYNAELASTSNYDRINGTGAISLAGTLNVSLAGGFDPPVGSTYDIISGPTVTGTFSTVNFPTLLNKKQSFLIYGPNYVRIYVTCYANCDGSTGSPALTANDFQCFLNRFAANDPYANCDQSSGNPILTANDFQCFLDTYAGGCNN